MSVRNIVQSAASSSSAGNSADATLYVDDVFSTWLYTGNGSTQTITNGIDLAGKGGLVWIKDRAGGGYSSHYLTNTVNGRGFKLSSDSTNPNYSIPSGYDLTSFNSNGFSLGTPYVTGVNTSGNPICSWTFRKAAKFFDVVTYTGNGTNPRNISHSLASTPGMVIVKRTDGGGGSWFVYHRSAAASGFTPEQCYMNLNETNAVSDNANIWYNTAPTSTEFTVGSQLNSSGGTYVAYLFAHNAGGFGTNGTDNIISCGSYVGNGATNSINLGYEPQWVLIKAASGPYATGSWLVMDTMRGLPGVTGVDTYHLFPNSTSAETGASTCQVTSTGFNVSSAANEINNAANTYIYMAIRMPNKPPTSGTQVYSPVTWTGTGTTQQITAGLTPDACLAFCRNRQATNSTWLFNRLIGVNTQLYTNDTALEGSDSGKAFTMTGLSNNSGNLNNTYNSSYYVGEFFKRAPGFFDVVCWTGNGGTQEVNHSLGVIPELLIYRSRTVVSDWNVVAKASTGYGGTKLNLTLALSFSFTETASSLHLTDTTFNPVYTFGNTSSPSVAYLFATLAGISKVGSYTGNGSSQTISCGFAAGARFILIKRTDAAADWYVWDSARGIVGANDPHLSLNTAVTEVTTNDSIDPDSSGFIVNQLAATNINVTSATYIFLAIA